MVKRFRGGLVFKAHRLVYHSTPGLRVVKKKKRVEGAPPPGSPSRARARCRPPARPRSVRQSNTKVPLYAPLHAPLCEPLDGIPRSRRLVFDCRTTSREQYSIAEQLTPGSPPAAARASAPLLAREVMSHGTRAVSLQRLRSHQKHLDVSPKSCFGRVLR